MLSTIFLAALAQTGHPAKAPVQRPAAPVSRPAPVDLAGARKAFAGLDGDHSGKLDALELASLALTAADREPADLDHDGVLTADEFMIAFRERSARAGATVAPDLEAEVARLRGAAPPANPGTLPPRAPAPVDAGGTPTGPAALRRRAEVVQRESPAVTEERVRAARAALNERLGQLHDDPKPDAAPRSGADVSVLRRSALDRARVPSGGDSALEEKARQAREALNRRLNDPGSPGSETPGAPGAGRIHSVPAPLPEKPIGAQPEARKPESGAPSPAPAKPPVDVPHPKPSHPTPPAVPPGAHGIGGR